MLKSWQWACQTCQWESLVRMVLVVTPLATALSTERSVASNARRLSGGMVSMTWAVDDVHQSKREEHCR